MEYLTESLTDLLAEPANYAASTVSDREATGDKSITLDKSEKGILFKKYSPKRIARKGGATPQGLDQYLKFNLITQLNPVQYTVVSLACVHPKAKGNELRLYFNKKEGFYPISGETCFLIAHPDHEIPFIGHLAHKEFEAWKSQDATLANHIKMATLDDEDDNYQTEINSPSGQVDGDGLQFKKKAVSSTTSSGKIVHHRDASAARDYLVEQKFQCEVDPSHETFLSASLEQPYMEVHHLIPISLTPLIPEGWSLDVKSNLVCLCPNCHRKFHFAQKQQKAELVRHFLDKRNDALIKAKIRLPTEQVLKAYTAL